MAASTLPTDAITPKSLYTITGAAAAVWLFGTVLYTVLGERVDEVIYRSIAFGLSLIIAIGMLIEKKIFKLKYWLLIIPNSALIFVNASGYNAVNTGSLSAPGVQGEKETSTTSISTSFGNGVSIQKASFLPFLKDIAWWPDPLLKEKVEVLEEINDSLKTENKVLHQKAGSINVADSLTAADNKNKIAAMEAQIQALQLENAALKTGNANNSELTATIEKLNATISSLRKQLNDKEVQLKNSNAQLQQARNDLATANTKLNECLKRGGANDALNDRINSLSTQLDQYKKNLSACENKLKNCNTKPGDPDGSPVVLDLQTELRKCKALLANSGNNAALQKQVDDLQSKLNSCLGQNEKYSSSLKNYASDLGQCNSRLKAVRDSLTNCLKPKISKTTSKIGGK